MFDKNLWLFLVVMTSINGVVWYFRSKKYIKANPELKQGYNRLIRGFFIYCNLPWLLIAIFRHAGLIQNSFDLAKPHNYQTGVIIWHIVVSFLVIAGTYWIFSLKGAEILCSHPGLFENTFNNKNNITVEIIKKFWLVVVLSAFIVELTLWV